MWHWKTNSCFYSSGTMLWFQLSSFFVDGSILFLRCLFYYKNNPVTTDGFLRQILFCKFSRVVCKILIKIWDAGKITSQHFIEKFEKYLWMFLSKFVIILNNYCKENDKSRTVHFLVYLFILVHLQFTAKMNHGLLGGWTDFFF